MFAHEEKFIAVFRDRNRDLAGVCGHESGGAESNRSSQLREWRGWELPQWEHGF
jgi:hypothetical protein